MIKLHGCSMSPGFGRGGAFVFGTTRPAVAHRRIDASAVDDEQRRLANALRLGAEELAHLQEHLRGELGETESAIFDAHLGLLKDPELVGRIAQYIEREQVNAEWAVESTIRELADALGSADNVYLRERAADIEDLGRRVMRHLLRHGQWPLAHIPAATVLVAQELFPLDLLEIDRAHLAGIVTERGGETGHAAILARALGIPAISGVTDATRLVRSGASLLVDGSAGIVWVDPDTEVAERFARSTLGYEQRLSAAISEERCEARTLDGVAIKLYANIGRAGEAEAVGRQALDGVGLFRTEYLFLDEPRAPSFDKHRAIYQNVAAQLGERPLVIRTLDLGGDKFPRFMASQHEASQTLGLRGLRFSLTHGRELFEIQLRAILAVALQHRDVRILLPMVLGPGDFSAARAIIDGLAQQAHLRDRPKVGAMIETPAAVLTAREVLELADFASIGTNDLTQFMLAADRNALGVSAEYSVLHPAVLRAIKSVADVAADVGKPVAVCGEAAADPALAGLLIGLGIRELSTSPSASALVRQRVRAISSRDATRQAADALQRRDAASVQALLLS
ncbi:phosphoenolpyruvate--protein phosphotransferase [Accumulibacter sp.]|uniref:phosphoenolpyruvate--protein phosphotransferase n=1 Tax=Accumulibacter sp. TaxID=2053492 RepID=UPI001DB7AA1C|nr:phosphoenolpyruvate--protein phosphotransferase [Accumulibacter sp.]MCB1964695.1 phosphoenolpyruvate--protein phosphotransferase [Accumulibacter sp.]MCP5227052.1 phosphoenolpyruvate--protein phosphotransferase [Accumulibacter sp.]